MCDRINMNFFSLARTATRMFRELWVFAAPILRPYLSVQLNQSARVMTTATVQEMWCKTSGVAHHTLARYVN